MKNEEKKDPGLAEPTAKTTPKTRSAEWGTRMKNDGNRHPKAVSAGHFDPKVGYRNLMIDILWKDTEKDNERTVNVCPKKRPSPGGASHHFRFWCACLKGF